MNTPEGAEAPSIVQYQYDNSGALAMVTDSESGITSTYYYDLIDRLCRHEGLGVNYPIIMVHRFNDTYHSPLSPSYIQGTAHLIWRVKMKIIMKEKKCQQCTHAFEKEYPIENTEQLLTLVQIYLSEWTHRDSLLWKQIFVYFFASLVVMVLPFVELWEIKLGTLIPDWIFPMVGLLMSLVFFIVAKGYASRLTAVGKVYNNLLQKLPRDYRRLSLDDINPNSISNIRMAYFVTYFMSFLLTALAITLLIISIVK